MRAFALLLVLVLFGCSRFAPPAPLAPAEHVVPTRTFENGTIDAHFCVVDQDCMIKQTGVCQKLRCVNARFDDALLPPITSLLIEENGTNVTVSPVCVGGYAQVDRCVCSANRCFSFQGDQEV